MDHQPALITTIAVGLTAAFIGGLVARRVGLPTIVGYLVAGVAIGPFTPGFIADTALATELAEIGVILLMFGVGIEFSIGDLLAVRRIAVPGALLHIAIVTVLGVAFGVLLGWGVGGGLVLGLAISIASTVVLLRALMERNELDTSQGRIALGWLIVEDLFTVLALVLLPTLAPLLAGTAGGDSTGTLLADVGGAILKAAVFAALILFVGARLVPRLLLIVARERSRELFTLSILAVALGIAFVASSLFGVSLALGAFLAGAVVSESDMSHQAAADALPLRDAFAVLFFVSVGMLLDPAFLLAQPLLVLAVTVLIVGVKAILKLLIVGAFGYPVRTALTVGAGLAQIGEFSFILATLGLSLGLLPAEGFQLIVAGALVSITLNPFLLRAVDPLDRLVREHPRLHRLLGGQAQDATTADERPRERLRGHVILCGYGRVAELIRQALERRGFAYIVVTDDRRAVDELRGRGIPALYGDASNAELLELAGVREARIVIVAVSSGHAARLIAERATTANPRINLVVRAASETELGHLAGLGNQVQAIHGEREVAVQMARYALRRLGVSTAEAEAIAQGLRGRTSFRERRPAERPRPGERLREWVRRQAEPSAPQEARVPPPPAAADVRSERPAGDGASTGERGRRDASPADDGRAAPT